MMLAYDAAAYDTKLHALHGNPLPCPARSRGRPGAHDAWPGDFCSPARLLHERQFFPDRGGPVGQREQRRGG
ncbi:MAG: hypothetical protein J7M26_06240 [Armatimonadetes bacterium]|nr:hypothetical protein [Armatimonadota bacterium]